MGKKKPPSTQSGISRWHATLVDYSKTFNTEHGKRVLYDLMESHYMLRPTLIKAGTSLELASREGERNVVLRVLSILKTTPKQYEQMLETHQKNIESQTIV